MRKNRFMLVVILLLGIGFAAVSTTLYLTGNVTIATNNEDFDVKFTKATSEEGATATISSDGKTITFGTKDLVTVGDKSILDFEVTNNSEMYDAEVSINCSATGDKSDYYKITSSGAMVIAGKTKGNGKVEVELLKASVTDEAVPFSCTLTATAKERTDKAEPAPLPVKYTPKYFAYGDPTTASTQDYTTLTYPSGSKAGQQAKVFVGLDADGVQKSVCIIRNGSLECFRGGATTAYVAEEQAHLREVFEPEVSCSSDSSRVNCSASDFYCSVYYSSGYVSCLDFSVSLGCYVYSDGSVGCTS